MAVLGCLLFLIISSQLIASSIDSEDDLPPHLRGIEWKNVEMELRKDMSLSSSVLPLSYDIKLNVSVRGYRGAERSTFHGSVVIDLNISSPIQEIELHSLGLSINKAQLISTSSTGSSKIAEINEITYNRERETVIFTLTEPVQPTANVQLMIFYNGTAVMRGYGLYESWTKPTNDSLSSLPTISLITNCSPTGARRWFPSFDEPDKKAKFRLTIQYPSNLTAYSNTEGQSRVIDDGFSETVFKQTTVLPTYVVAFALTEKPVIELEHDGHMIRVIGGNEEMLDNVVKAYDFVRNQPAFANVSFIPEKTDWLVVDDFPFSAMENPGLITVKEPLSNITIIHELAHMYFGNLVTHRSWDQVWLKEGFATFVSGAYGTGESYRLFYEFQRRDSASFYEPALFNQFSYSRTQFIIGNFFSYGDIHYFKAAQLISLFKRYIGEEIFDRALNRYLIDNSFGNGDTEMMINYLSGENQEARTILIDWIYQPGAALLYIAEEDERVVIRQRRIHMTDFDDKLRDKKTRWTIPLFYTINGVEHVQVMPREVDKFILNIPANSNFSIDESYSLLYVVDYANRTEERMEKEERKESILNSAFNATEISEDMETFCNINASNSSREELWEMYLIQGNASYLMCVETLHSRENAARFLRNLLLTNELPVRSQDLNKLVTMINDFHPGILLDFLTEEHQNIELISIDVCGVIQSTAMKEQDGIEKLRNTVRMNPSFAANFYHMFTNIFENDFVRKFNEAQPLNVTY